MRNMNEFFTKFDNIFFEKTRLSMIALIFKEEILSFKGLKKALEISDGALYSHIEKLIEAGYMEKTREIAGTSVQTVYKLSSQGKKAFSEYLTFMEKFLSEEKNK
jgi:predicted transcriptional regulator